MYPCFPGATNPMNQLANSWTLPYRWFGLIPEVLIYDSYWMILTVRDDSRKSGPELKKIVVASQLICEWFVSGMNIGRPLDLMYISYDSIYNTYFAMPNIKNCDLAIVPIKVLAHYWQSMGEKLWLQHGKYTNSNKNVAISMGIMHFGGGWSPLMTDFYTDIT